MELTLKVSLEEANLILGVLGDLPTKTGVHHVWLRLKNDCEQQVKAKEAQINQIVEEEKNAE